MDPRIREDTRFIWQMYNFYDEWHRYLLDPSCLSTVISHARSNAKYAEQFISVKVYLKNKYRNLERMPLIAKKALGICNKVLKKEKK